MLNTKLNLITYNNRNLTTSLPLRLSFRIDSNIAVIEGIALKRGTIIPRIQARIIDRNVNEKEIDKCRTELTTDIRITPKPY